MNYTQDGVISSPLQKPMDLKQLKQRAAAIPPIVSSAFEHQFDLIFRGFMAHVSYQLCLWY